MKKTTQEGSIVGNKEMEDRLLGGEGWRMDHPFNIKSRVSKANTILIKMTLLLKYKMNCEQLQLVILRGKQSYFGAFFGDIIGRTKRGSMCKRDKKGSVQK